MISETDYTEQVKRVAVELLCPLSDIDKIDIVLRSIDSITPDKIKKILEVLGYKTGLEGGEE